MEQKASPNSQITDKKNMLAFNKINIITFYLIFYLIFICYYITVNNID